MIHKIKRVTWQFSFCLLVVTAIGLSMVRFFLLSIDDYKDAIESKIFELTEIPLEIGELQANMRGFNPGIILKDIRILTPENKQSSPLKLEEIRFSINLIDLAWTRELLPSSWLTLVGVKLSIVRLEDGSLSIVGLNPSKSEQPYWLLNGGRYEVLKSEITWLDKQRNAAPLRFDNVDLLIKSGSGSQNHEVHLLSQLPDSIGESLRISMSIQGNIFKKDNINGLIYINASKVQLAKVITGEQPLGLKVAAGKGDFELWSQWENSKNIALSGNIQASNIKIKKHKETYKANDLSTAFFGFNQHEGWQLGLTDFKMKAHDKSWPAASFIFAGNHSLTQFSISIEQSDLQQASELAQFFAPLEKENKTLLAQLGIKGQINDFSAYIDTEKNSFAINGEFNNIFTSTFSHYPEIKNFSASIQGTEQQGVIGFNTQKASLFFPEIFRKAIPIKHFSGQLAWQQQVDSWLLESEQLVLNVKDAETNNKLSLSLSNIEAPIFMDLQSSIANIEDVSAISDYYPARMMSKDVLSWLDKVFVSGKIKQGGLLFVGNLNEYPFSQGQGVFEVLLDASDVELQFSPEWPHLHKVNAEIAIQQNHLAVTSNHAKVKGIHIGNVLVEIPHLERSRYVLVQGRATGTAGDGLKFMQKTPLQAIADNFLDVIEPSGNVEVYLKTKVPLVYGLEPIVDGGIKLKQLGLNIKPIALKVADVNGLLTFTEKGLFAEKIKAKALGNPIKINIETLNSNTAVAVKGTTGISQLQKQFSFFDSELFVNKRIKGDFNYQLVLDLPAAAAATTTTTAQLNISTNLQGISIDLPGKLKKTASEEKSLELKFLLNDAELLPLKIRFNNDIKAAISLDKQQKQLYSANIIYGAGQAVMPKEKIVSVQVNQAIFDMTEWLAVFNNNTAQQQSKPMVDEISIKTENLVWNKQSYGFFDMFMRQNEQQWLGGLNSTLAKGRFAIPLFRTKQSKIKLEMDYIKLAAFMKSKPKKNEAAIMADFSLIDVFSKQLLWKGENLGVLEIETERIANGVRFKPVNLTSKNAKLMMSADWVKQGQKSVTVFQGVLTADDMGSVLSKVVDNGHELIETKASIKYSGQWPNAPYQFSLEDMEAEVDVTLEHGRISSIEPGFGRALGFLASEQWIKRLTLDFGDLYKKGLSFNRITGLFKVQQGVAHTDRLFIDSIPAKITISGETDLLTKTLDYNISVIPKSSGALPIAGTIISGIAGTITQILVNDYKEGYFFGSKYHAAGKWGDIKLDALLEHDGIFNKTWTGFTDLFQDELEPE